MIVFVFVGFCVFVVVCLLCHFVVKCLLVICLCVCVFGFKMVSFF